MVNTVASVAALAASLLSTSALAADCTNVLTPDYQTPSMADGWSSQLIVRDLKKPRTITFDTSGNLIVLEGGKGVSRITLKDNGGTCLEVEKSVVLIDNTELNHGLAFSDDGKTLYASTVESVYAWSYDASTGTIGTDTSIVVANMSNNALVTRTLLMSRKQPGKLIITRGADENNDVDASDVSTGLSQIRIFDTSSSSVDTYDFNNQGTVLGWGIRNAVGVAEHPSTGGIWSVETSVDDITRDGVDVHQNNPGEELNYHGVLADLDTDVVVTDSTPNYGYPFCYALWDTNIPNLGDLEVGDQFSMDSGNDTACMDDYQKPRLVFHAHTSPLNLLFTEDGSGAYFAFHGSFNRDNPVGYTLSYASFGDDGQPTEPSTSKMALTDIMWNPTQSDCPDNCFRPLGLAWDSQGRLWMTSDSTGEIYVVSNDGSSSSPSGDDDSSATEEGDEDENAATDTRTMGAAVFAGVAALVTALLMA